MRYAGFWIRAFATLVDVAALWFAEIAVVFVLWSCSPERGESMAAMSLTPVEPNG